MSKFEISDCGNKWIGVKYPLVRKYSRTKGADKMAFSSPEVYNTSADARNMDSENSGHFDGPKGSEEAEYGDCTCEDAEKWSEFCSEAALRAREKVLLWPKPK